MLSFRGDYGNCDIPPWTAKAVLQYAAEVEKVIKSNSHQVYHCIGQLLHFLG